MPECCIDCAAAERETVPRKAHLCRGFGNQKRAIESTMEPDLEALVAEFLGPRYAGRRFLRYHELEALGLVDNRATLKLWMDAGSFPRGLKLPGPHGKTLVWSVPELVRFLAQRAAERDPSNEKGAHDATGRPSFSDSNEGDPFARAELPQVQHPDEERCTWTIYDAPRR
jgi:hypothetical protein